MASKSFKDIERVLISNVLSLASSILVAFLLPQIMSVNEFGYYKTFTLYISYVGLLHFGFCDGIYLIYGGRDYDSLKRESFVFYFKFLICFELFVAIIIAIISYFILPNDLKPIFYALALYSIVHIVSSYYQLVSQAIRRFGEFSNRNNIYSCLRLLGVLLLFASFRYGMIISYKWIIILMIILEVLLSLWYILTYKDLSFGKTNKCWSEIPIIFKTGFPLLIANLSTTVLLALDRQFVNVLFNKHDYAIYAFAYSLLALVTTMTTAISIVLFPNLKRLDPVSLKRQYPLLSSYIMILVLICLTLYYPLKLIIHSFLPQYIDSLIIFRIVFPGLAISSCINIIMFNYYKVLNRVPIFCHITLLIIIVSAIANYVVYHIFGTTVSISMASIVTMFFWYLLAEFYFVRIYHIKRFGNIAYIFLTITCFYFSTSLSNDCLGLLFYLVLYAFLTYLFKRNELYSLTRGRT